MNIETISEQYYFSVYVRNHTVIATPVFPTIDRLERYVKLNNLNVFDTYTVDMAIVDGEA
jgi:hypothetical protein